MKREVVTGARRSCPECGITFSGDSHQCTTLIQDDADARKRHDPNVGTVLAQKYRILELIGRGGMSTVYRAHHLLIGNDVAVKLLHAHLISDEKSIRRFQIEAKAAGALNHKNIITLFDFGLAENRQPYLIMELLRGSTISEVIQERGSLKADEALPIFVDVLDGLHCAHQCGVIHRDLKPSNVVLTTDQQGNMVVKLVDFGIAKLAVEGPDQHKLTQTGDVLGSPLYMSPEQCSGKPLDTRSDIYSLGCLMYEVLTGQPPLAGSNVFETISLHCTKAPVNLRQLDESIPEGLDFVVMRCLAKEPRHRYQTAAELKDALLNSTKVKSSTAYEKRPSPVRHQLDLKERTPLTEQLQMVGLVLLLILGIGLSGALFFKWLSSEKAAPSASAGHAQKGASKVTPINPGPSNAKPLGAAIDETAVATNFDALSHAHFVKKEYKQAIPLLQYGIQHYRQTKQLVLLADNLQHLGRCYVMEEQPYKALPHYAEAVSIYKAFGPEFYRNPQNLAMEAVNDYANLLRSLRRNSEAAQLESDFK